MTLEELMAAMDEAGVDKAAIVHSSTTYGFNNDYVVDAVAARVPADLKVRDGGKWILKEASRAVVPAEVIDRPKGYFPVPALKYLRGPFLAFVHDILDAPAARERGLFRREYVERLLSDPERELTPKRHSKLWQVALLEGWLQAQGI